MTFPGPPELGRGAVVPAGTAVPQQLADATRVRIDDDVLVAPAATIRTLAECWARRGPVVVDLAVDASEIARPETSTAAPWTLDPGFEFTRRTAGLPRLGEQLGPSAAKTRCGGEPERPRVWEPSWEVPPT